MLVIPWLLKSESDKLLSAYDSFFDVSLCTWETKSRPPELISLRISTTIKNGFVLDLVGFRNENAIISRTAHQSNLLPGSPISEFPSWDCFTICKIKSVLPDTYKTALSILMGLAQSRILLI